LKGQFYATFPAAIAAGDYSLIFYNTTSALFDPNLTSIGGDRFFWDGTKEITDYTIATDVNHSAHEWYVSKSGNDSSDGHNPQNAKLTIMAAVNAANNGDTVYIYPGDYDETVDLTGKNYITLDGFNKGALITRTGSGQKGIIGENGSKIRNLRVSTTSKTANTIGFYASEKSYIKIENCEILGAFDGIYLDTCSNIDILNNHIESYYDGMNAILATNLNVNDNTFVTNGSYATNIHAHGVTFSNSYNEVIFVSNRVYSNRNDSSSYSVHGVYNSSARLKISDNSIKVSAGSNNTGNVYGIYTNTIVNANNNYVFTTTSGSGTCYDLYNSTSDFWVDNSFYDPAKTYGTIINYSRTASNKATSADANTTEVLYYAGLIDANTALTNFSTPEENAEAVFDHNGITAGGTWTYEKILKLQMAWLLGEWQDKAGSPGVYEILDVEDKATSTIEMDINDTSKYKGITIP
jgi:hypothetical protein